MAACLARAALTHPTGIALPQTFKHGTDDGNRCSFRPPERVDAHRVIFCFSEAAHTSKGHIPRASTRHTSSTSQTSTNMTIQEPGHPPSTQNRIPRPLLYWSPLEWFRALVPPSWVKAGVPPSQKSGDVAVLESHSNSFSSRVGMNIELGTLSSCHSFLGSFSFKLVRRCSFLGTTASSGLRHG